MSSQSISRRLLALLVLGILLGVIGGGVMGGAVGLYVAGSHPTLVVSSPSAELTSAKTTNPPVISSNLSVTEDSAIIDTVKKAEPAVVTVINTLETNAQQQAPGRQNPFGPNNPTGPSASIAEGSGVIIDASGHIITNDHVVEGARSLDVVFEDGTKTSAQLIGTDPISDIAVLQVKGSVPAYLTLGDSSALQLGETAIAIGSPLGNYRGSVTAGIISGLNRSVEGSGQEDLIQTDAAINHGNSGGPLLNLAGQVIGINTLVVRDTTSGDAAQGLGFAVPSNTVSSVANQILSQGKVEYPYIGITFGEITPAAAGQFNLPAQQGAYVQQVAPNSPASAAGLQAQDVIQSLNNTAIDENHSLRSLLFQHHPGETVTLKVLRNNQTLNLQVKLTARPPDTNANVPG